jgi:MerR family redox-sensitive transcriptional activator SoxR
MPVTVQLEVNFKSRPPRRSAVSEATTERPRPMTDRDLLTIGEVARRGGVATSALRYYEKEGVIPAIRTEGGQRRYPRSVLRRIAFVRAAQSVGLSLDEIREALATLPEGRAPTKADWARLSRSWRARLDDQIAGLEKLRDGLTTCIGCGCLSLRDCSLMNPGDAASRIGAGARYLPAALRRPPHARG